LSDFNIEDELFGFHGNVPAHLFQGNLNEESILPTSNRR
jgi:hypothetical protein